MNLDSIITDSIKEHLEQAIANAEQKTSAELRVHIEDLCKEDPFDRAAYVFRELKMHQTQLRNGVLIYIALGSKNLVIMGDAGINQHMNQQEWDGIRDRIIEQFKHAHYEQGIIEGIEAIGKKLQTHFPNAATNANELSNKITTQIDVH